MRIADTIPHPSMRIIIYQLEKHFYLEFEAGPMKQGFRFSKEHVGGVEPLKKMVDNAFIENVENRFHQMHKQALEAVKKNSAEE